MAKVTLKFNNLKKFRARDIASRRFQKRLGTIILDAMLRLIAVGKSPVKGEGRYKGYKVDRSGGNSSRRSDYPNSVKNKFPGKQKRPVNLRLSGKLLDAMKFGRIVGGVKIGLIGASSILKKIFEAHNEGTLEDKNVPRRAILPTGTGENFTASISRKIRFLYQQRIKEMLKKANKR